MATRQGSSGTDMIKEKSNQRKPRVGLLTGDELRSFRLGRNWSQAQMAEWAADHSDVRPDRHRISAWEAGREAMTSTSLSAAIKAAISLDARPAGEDRAGVVIAVALHKGGVGKTTSVLNLAGLARQDGMKVLVIDADAGGHLSVGLGIDKDVIDAAPGLANLLDQRGDDAGPGIVADIARLAGGRGRKEDRPRSDPAHVVMATDSGIDLLLPGGDLDLEEERLRSRTLVEFAGRPLMQWARRHYDLILVDCAPNAGLIVRMMLVAADAVLLPCETRLYSVNGLMKFLKILLPIMQDREANPDLRLLGVLPTKHDNRVKDNVEQLAMLGENLGRIKLYPPVPRAEALAASVGHGRPTVELVTVLPGRDAFRAVLTDIAQLRASRSTSATAERSAS